MHNTLIVHLTLIPYMSASGELKTKPTQHSVKMMLENGLQPDVLVLRTEKELTAEVKRKVALFCNVDADAVIESIDVSTIYEVPLRMQAQGLDTVALRKLDLKDDQHVNLDTWCDFVERVKSPQSEVKIGLVGKYTELPDAYKSISEAFIHSGAQLRTKVRLEYVNAELITAQNVEDMLGGMDAILVAPGFGHRGLEGKLVAVRYARESKVPFLGICLGMQCSVVEFARNVLGLEDANSAETGETSNPVIDIMEEQKEVTEKGGTMRLGAYRCQLTEGSNAAKAYGTTEISERHRHRYEFNAKYREQLEKAGLRATGVNPDTGLVEVVEIEDHPWFVGVQFHPEYKSTVENPHPLFVAFTRAALENK